MKGGSWVWGGRKEKKRKGGKKGVAARLIKTRIKKKGDVYIGWDKKKKREYVCVWGAGGESQTEVRVKIDDDNE